MFNATLGKAGNGERAPRSRVAAYVQFCVWTMQARNVCSACVIMREVHQEAPLTGRAALHNDPSESQPRRQHHPAHERHVECCLRGVHEKWEIDGHWWWSQRAEVICCNVQAQECNSPRLRLQMSLPLTRTNSENHLIGLAKLAVGESRVGSGHTNLTHMRGLFSESRCPNSIHGTSIYCKQAHENWSK